MKLSSKKLQKLRSGQTVFKVWGQLGKDESGTLKPKMYCEQRQALGKKVKNTTLFPDFVTTEGVTHKGHSVFEFLWAGDGETNRYQQVHFVGDCLGFGCFTSRRQAERFAREVEQGIHKDINERMQMHHNWMQDMADHFDEYEDDYWQQVGQEELAKDHEEALRFQPAQMPL